jgi:NAD-dependent dihydropyrimidine dehydrogenase PreA subunit
MAYKINPDVCVKCGVCKENCPVECIKEQDDKMVINPDECVDCGTCAANCPVNAIDPA